MTQINLTQLVNDLSTDGGPDLRGYKHSTLERRIKRRMSELNIGSYGGYLEYVRKSPREPAALLSKVLINVTEFFRDPPGWEFLRVNILPQLTRDMKAGDSFRAWTAGCATGEEAYSVALLLAEYFGTKLNSFDVKIYATDIDDDALAVARRGEYDAEKLRRVPPELREKYFSPVGNTLRVNRDLRRLLIFGRSNLVSNAPISHCNLVVCRNVLIYFDTPSQKRILERLHYALDPGAVLFLGKAESKLTDSSLFKPINSRWRIFQRIGSTVQEFTPPAEFVAASDGASGGDHELRALRIYQRHILDAIRAGLIALDANDTVVTHNDAAALLWGINAAKLAGRRVQNTDLVFRCPELVTRLEATRAGGNETVTFQCTVKSNSHDGRVLSVVLRPVISDDQQRVGTIIYCDDLTDREKLQTMVEQFEATSEELQSANEELETTNEELQSTNEELETTNEELQSSNEELETTNEELQSLNEELENMNDELEQRTQELTQLNSRYTSTLHSMPWPVVLVDPQERIQLWNTAAQQLFGVGATSVVGVDIDRLPLEASARAALVRRLRGVMGNRKPTLLRNVHLRNRADLGDFDIHFTPVSRAEGNIEGVLIMFGLPSAAGDSHPAGLMADGSDEIDEEGNGSRRPKKRK